MRIQELFRLLSYGELSNLDLSGEGSGTIKKERYPQLINYINEGLLKLYSRFPLLQKDLIIELRSDITIYPLKLEYAESVGSNVEYPFIKDRPGKEFTGDVIKILEVHSSCGSEYTLNDKGNPHSLFTPQPDVLQVPYPKAGIALGVQYQARHPKLLDTGSKILAQNIELPFFLESALQNYVAHKVYGHMNGAENTAKSQEFQVNFERLCADIEQKDLVNQTFSTTQSKLEMRGFR
jgi:hypothetical protein